MAQYSITPLIKKLGLKEGMEALFINEPEEYIRYLGKLPKNLAIKHEFQKQVDFIHLFTRSQEELKELFPKLKEKLKKSGMIWISWPKGSCGVGVTNLNENLVRMIGLENGLVDVKVISVDEKWSGLKFVYRLKNRD